MLDKAIDTYIVCLALVAAVYKWKTWRLTKVGPYFLYGVGVAWVFLLRFVDDFVVKIPHLNQLVAGFWCFFTPATIWLYYTLRRNYPPGKKATVPLWAIILVILLAVALFSGWRFR